MSSLVFLVFMVGQLNLIETGNLATFMKEGYRLSCTQYVSMTLSDAASCAINCLSSDNCAGLTYNSSNNLCSTCPGNDVTDLLFVADDFMLPRTEWFTKLDATNLIYFPLKSTLKPGSLVYMSILADDHYNGYYINLMGQASDYYVFHFRLVVENNVYLDSILNSRNGLNWPWDFEIVIQTPELFTYSKRVDIWYLITQTGYRVYIDGKYSFSFSHRYPVTDVVSIAFSPGAIIYSVSY